MKRILAWHHGAVGDLILSLPALRAIRRRHAGCSIHLICRTDLHEIIIFNGLADHVTSNEDGGLAAFFQGPSDQTARFMRGYEAAYVFSRSEGSLDETIRSHNPEMVQIRTIPPAEERIHAGWYQLQQIMGHAQEAAEDLRPLHWPALSPPPGDGKVVCIHPGSGGSGKCWPLHRYLLLTEQFLRGGYAVKVLLGPAEDGEYGGQLAALSARIGTDMEVVSQQPLTSVASHLKSAACYIGNDSGITHLAGALGVPGVAIFGPTDHVIWRPWGDAIGIVETEALCAPCGEAHRGCRRRVCLDNTSLQRVEAAAAAALGQGRFRSPCSS